MRLNLHGITASALVVCVAAAGMAATAAIQPPGPEPDLAQAPHASPSGTPGKARAARVKASTMPVTARRIPAPDGVILAAYGQAGTAPSSRAPSPAGTAGDSPGPAAARPSPASSPVPRQPAPAVAVAVSSCAVNLNILGLGGCAGIGG